MPPHVNPVLLDPMGLPASKRVVQVNNPLNLKKTPVITLTRSDGSAEEIYGAWPKQVQLHATTVPKFILEGERGTGKSHCLRWDCHLKALAYPGYKYLILRRTMPELRKSHLTFIGREMEKLGGFFHKTNVEAHYPNGSLGLFGHCETEQDIEKYLSAEFYQIVFDEIVTFDWDMITRIGGSCRVPPDSGLIAFIRGGTNPLGVSAEEVYRYFIARDITPEEDPEYDASEWGSMHMVMDDNPSLDKVQYHKQLAGLPEAYRKAWLHGEWGVEGAYFSIADEHLTNQLPMLESTGQLADSHSPIARPMLQWEWLNVYRLLDFGWHDPTVCVWVAVLPNGREIPFQEMSWVRTPASTVAQDIKEASGNMRVITTIADPTMWNGEREMGHSLADEFEQRGVPLTKGKNDRVAAGLAIQEHLNTMLPDGKPKLMLYENEKQGVPTLVRALRAMRVDKKIAGRIADHRLDHMPICLGYFCMAGVGPTRVPSTPGMKPWMVPKTRRTDVLGREGVRQR